MIAGHVKIFHKLSIVIIDNFLSWWLARVRFFGRSSGDKKIAFFNLKIFKLKKLSQIKATTSALCLSRTKQIYLSRQGKFVSENTVAEKQQQSIFLLHRIRKNRG